jgi:transcription initiation factor TFIIE subunit alpha
LINKKKSKSRHKTVTKKKPLKKGGSKKTPLKKRVVKGKKVNKVQSKKAGKVKGKKVNKKPSNVLKLKKPLAKKTKPAVKSGSLITIKSKRGISNSVVRKKNSLKVVSTSKTISEEQKVELKKLHGILSDSFVRQMLIEVGGENALVIVRNFYGAHSDEELSKNLALRISDVRATLNRLHNEGLVKYKRAKDSETGWYSYAWTLNQDRIVKWVSNFAQKHNGRNEEDGIDYYFCPKCGLNSIIEFEHAHENEFKCGKCLKPLEFVEEEHFASINQMLKKP